MNEYQRWLERERRKRIAWAVIAWLVLGLSAVGAAIIAYVVVVTLLG